MNFVPINNQLMKLSEKLRDDHAEGHIVDRSDEAEKLERSVAEWRHTLESDTEYFEGRIKELEGSLHSALEYLDGCGDKSVEPIIAGLRSALGASNIKEGQA